MGNVNALARGINSLLDLTTQGQTPGDLSQVIQSQIDLLPFLLLNKRQRLLLGPTATGLTTGDFDFATTVPQNEAWILYSYCVSAQLPLGQTGELVATAQMWMQNSAIRQAFMLGPASVFGRGVVVNTIRAYMDPPLFILPPNSLPGFLLSNIAAASAFSCYGFIDYVPVRL